MKLASTIKPTNKSPKVSALKDSHCLPAMPTLQLWRGFIFERIGQ